MLVRDADRPRTLWRCTGFVIFTGGALYFSCPLVRIPEEFPLSCTGPPCGAQNPSERRQKLVQTAPRDHWPVEPLHPSHVKRIGLGASVGVASGNRTLRCAGCLTAACALHRPASHNRAAERRLLGPRWTRCTAQLTLGFWYLIAPMYLLPRVKATLYDRIAHRRPGVSDIHQYSCHALSALRPV